MRSDIPQDIARSIYRIDREIRRSATGRGARNSDGWIPFYETCTYASGTTFTIAEDVTGLFEVGDRIQLKQGGGFLQYEVTAVSYSAPNTTVTVSGSTALTNTTITDVYYSKMFGPFGAKCMPPKRADMWHHEALVVTGNALAYSAWGTPFGHVYRQNAGANGDVFTNGCYLAAGVYTFKVMGGGDVNCAKVDWTLDGVSIAAGQDWYATSGAYHEKSTSSVSVPYSGWHTIRGTINGRNGSNTTGWLMNLTKYWFVPGAD